MKKSNRFIKNLVFIFGILTIFSFFTTFQYGKEEIKTKDIVIKNNDTIWNIASDICDENDSLNIQNVVIQIKQINNMTTSDLYVGQQLKIPIY